MKEIIIYTTEDNKCPFLEWQNSLSTEYKVRVNKRLQRLREGYFGDWKHLQNSKLSELRLDFGKGYRIYFKEMDNIIILIIAGSDKSNQKSTINKANKYFEEYINRRKINGDKI